MEIMQELQLKYGYNAPILLNTLEIEGMTESGIRQALTRLSRQGKIARYAQGVYYIPQMTAFGSSRLSAKKVYERKYITDGAAVYGYYCGLALENAIGLTTQMPNRIEIVTNKESSRVREVQIGNQKVRLRKSKIEITSKNVRLLQFLDLVSQINWNNISAEEKNCVYNFAKELKIKKEDVYEYIRYYPSRVAKAILESRLTDEFV